MKKCPVCEGKGGWWIPLAPIFLPYFARGQKWIECKKYKGKGEINDGS